VLAALVALASAGARAAARDEPPAPERRTEAEPAPIPVIVNAPGDLDALLQALARPDFVILRGDEYERLRKAGQGQAGPPRAPAGTAVVESVAVRGSVRGDIAEVTVTVGVALGGDGPEWVALRLDGQPLTDAKEGDRDLPRRVGAQGAWQVELAGKGRHEVRVGVLTPVRATAEGSRLELAIPEAAATRFEVDVPQHVLDARAGPGEPVARAGARESGRTRLRADLSPRPHLAVVWKVEEEAGAALPPLLVARGEIAVDVGPGSFRTRSSWSIRSLRGAARSLQLRLDPDDEVLELELDGQLPPSGIERVDGTTRLTIPLPEPLGPGQEHRLAMTTRRATPAGAAARVAFRGFPITSAREQTGVIGVVQGGDLWVSGAADRGVRTIDPRYDLPDDLRARPATVRAYQFTEQPFELDLLVEPSPPQLRAEARTTVVLDPTAARIDTWLDYQPVRGRQFEVTLGLPPGLQVETVGPEGLVGSWQTGTLPTSPLSGGLEVGLRLLAVRLDPRRVQDGGRFSLHVVGRQRLDPSRDVAAVGFVQPIGAVPVGGRVAVVTDPSLTAELSDPAAGAAGPSPLRPAVRTPPADWPWPAGRRATAAPALWLRYDESLAQLGLLVRAHPLALKTSTTLLVRVDRREADVQQETECAVHFGSLGHLDVTVPAALEGLWEVDRGSVASRTDLGKTQQGDRTFRLDLPGELTGTTRLRFHYRLPLPRGLDPQRPSALQVPWVRVEGATDTSAPVRATVLADPGLAVAVRGDDWTPSADRFASAPAGGDEEPASDRLEVTGDGEAVRTLGLTVTARVLAGLPKLVVPRLGLLTVQTPEGELRTTAWIEVDTQDAALDVALPPGAELLRARVAGEAVRQVEPLPRGRGIRLRLPAHGAGASAVPVELEYTLSRSRAGPEWAPPRLPDGVVVQQTFWEVRLPWNLALVGVPGGWSDENEWFWDTYVWKRRPWKGVPALFGANPESQSGGAADDPDSRPVDEHGYLFSRAGEPAALPVFVASRAWLVAVCSGSVLAVGGFLILVWRPSVPLAWAASLVLGLSAALLHPSVIVLAVQSGMVGLLLAALIALMQRSVERRRPAPGAFADPSGRTPPLAAGSTLSRTVGAGSDDSTAIRVRPVSTMDYTPALPPSALPDDEGGVESRGGRSERVGPGGPPP
jgi:hypothetical protein